MNLMNKLIQDIYLTLILVNFILVPFAYFSGEEKVDFLDSDFDADKKKSKYTVAIKYTVLHFPPNKFPYMELYWDSTVSIYYIDIKNHSFFS